MPLENAAREEVFDLYETAIAEYRFQVQLNWDRTKHYFTFTGVMLGAATGLLKLEGPWALDVLVAGLFGCAAFVGRAGAHGIAKGHAYYRAIRDQVVALQRDLGLEGPRALATTPGMQESARLASDPRAWRRFPWERDDSITTKLVSLLWVVQCVAVVGVALALVQAYNHARDTPARSGNAAVMQRQAPR